MKGEFSLGRDLLKKDLVIKYGITVLVLVIINTFAIKISNNKIEKLALNYFYEEQYDKSIDLYKKLSKVEKNKALWDARIAEVYYLKKDNENCDKYLQSAKSKQDNNGEALNTILFVSLMNYNFNNVIDNNDDNNINEIIQLGESYLKEYPNKKDLIKTMIQVYLTNSELDKAKSLVEKYPVDQNSAEDIAIQGSMFISLQQFDKGIEKLRQAYMVNKDEFKIYDVLAQGHQYEKVSFSNKIIQLYENNKEDEMLKLFVSKIYSLESETSKKALDMLGELGENQNNGEMLEPYLIKIVALQNSGNNSESEALLKDLILKHKNDFKVSHIGAWYYYKSGQYDKAREYALKSIELNKSYVDNYGFLVPEILKMTMEGKGAEPYLYTSVKLEPYNYTLQLNKGYYYWHVKKDSLRAVEFLNNANLYRRNDSENYYDMSLIYLENNNYDKAIKLLKKCLEINNNAAKYHRTLGTTYLLVSDNVNAIKEIKTAYAIDNTDALTLNNAGCYYLTVEGDLEKALTNIEEANKGLKKEDDEYTRKTIKENYDKLLNLKEKYISGKDNEVISIPDLTMFY